MGIRHRSAILLAALGGAAVVPRQAPAAPSVRLVYVRGPGAEQCPAESAVRAAVSARLGYDPFFDWAHENLLVEIQRGPRAFRVVVKLVGADSRPRGVREISVGGDACSTVIDALALSISLTIDATAAAAPASPPPPPPPLDRPSPAPPVAVLAATPPTPQPPPEAGQAPALSLHAGVGAVGSVGAAPAATAGGTLFVGARWRALSLDVEGRADLPAAGDSEAPPVGVRSWLVAGALVPCLHAGVAFGCGVAAVGRLGAAARNVPTVVEQHGPWSAAGLRIGVEWPVGRALSLQGYAQLLAALTRDTLWIDATRIYTVPVWSPAVGASAAFRFR
jgi:hypothetical protein